MPLRLASISESVLMVLNQLRQALSGEPMLSS